MRECMYVYVSILVFSSVSMAHTNTTERLTTTKRRKKRVSSTLAKFYSVRVHRTLHDYIHYFVLIYLKKNAIQYSVFLSFWNRTFAAMDFFFVGLVVFCCCGGGYFFHIRHISYDDTVVNDVMDHAEVFTFVLFIHLFSCFRFSSFFSHPIYLFVATILYEPNFLLLFLFFFHLTLHCPGSLLRRQHHE